MNATFISTDGTGTELRYIGGVRNRGHGSRNKQPNKFRVNFHNDDHWKFLRDVLVFQLKMLLDNVRDFALMPVSLVAALIDLIFKGERQGSLFYQVLKWRAHSEEVINVYSAIEAHERPGVNPNYTIDAVIARLEGVLVRECEKGGTAASIKTAHTDNGIKPDLMWVVRTRAILMLVGRRPTANGSHRVPRTCFIGRTGRRRTRSARTRPGRRSSHRRPPA